MAAGAIEGGFCASRPSSHGQPPPDAENNGSAEPHRGNLFSSVCQSVGDQRRWFVFLLFLPVTYNGPFCLASHLPFTRSPFTSPLIYRPPITLHARLVPSLHPDALQHHHNESLLRLHRFTPQRMLIAHLIGGVILLAPFLLRMPQTSSALSIFFTTFKAMTQVSFLEQIEDVFSFSPAFIDSPRSYSDVVFPPNPPVTDLIVYYPTSQYSNLGSATSVNASTEVVAQEVRQEKCFMSLDWDEEKPVSTPASYFNIFLLLAPPCAILTLYLAYVSPWRS